MLFDIPFVADWHKIGERWQLLTDRGNQWENAKRIDYDYKIGDKVLVINDGFLRKAESAYGKEPWTITTVHTNGTIRIQHGTKTEWLNIQRVDHLQITFYEEGKIITTNNKTNYFSHPHKILCVFDGNTVLTSFMTSQIVAVNFFP